VAAPFFIERLIHLGSTHPAVHPDLKGQGRAHPIHMLRYQKPTMKVPTAQAEIACHALIDSKCTVAQSLNAASLGFIINIRNKNPKKEVKDLWDGNLSSRITPISHHPIPVSSTRTLLRCEHHLEADELPLVVCGLCGPAKEVHHLSQSSTYRQCQTSTQSTRIIKNLES
jgi:hypothetical protein